MSQARPQAALDVAKLLDDAGGDQAFRDFCISHTGTAPDPAALTMWRKTGRFPADWLCIIAVLWRHNGNGPFRLEQYATGPDTTILETHKNQDLQAVPLGIYEPRIVDYDRRVE